MSESRRVSRIVIARSEAESDSTKRTSNILFEQSAFGGESRTISHCERSEAIYILNPRFVIRNYIIMIIKINSSQKIELIDITDKVQQITAEQNFKDGICVIFVPHTTCGVIINENQNALKNDFAKVINFLKNLGPFEHDTAEGNAYAHIASSLFGHSVAVPVENGKLSLGTWQSIMLLESDGPREREVRIEGVANRESSLRGTQ